MKLKFFLFLAVFFLFFFVFYQSKFSVSKQSIQQIPNPKPSKTIISKPNYIPTALTIDSIFSDNHSSTNLIPLDRKRVLIATGDIIPARSVNYKEVTNNDFTWPYAKVFDILKNADITFANLETPLIKNCAPTVEGMVFCGNIRNTQGLLLSGIDIVNLANNHAGNYDINGLSETKKLLNDNKILTTGIDKAEIIDVRGIKFAFLGYNDVTIPQPGVNNAENEEKIKSDILEAKKNADIIIVAAHWGTEYQPQPDERQKYLARLIIDAGADLIIGNHPHWIQPIEFYKGKLITYAHGNFIFDQEWSLETKQGVIGKYTFYDNQLVDVEFLPVLIEDYGQPHFLTGEEKNKIIDNMKFQSKKLELL